MHRKKRFFEWAAMVIAFFVVIVLIGPISVQAVPLVPGVGAATNWVQLPPYNLLWPLWSPALSPVDPVTGLPTPIVPSVSNATILPVQPGLFWDPSRTYPFFLYNIPLLWGGGLTYFDAFYGLNPWPPSYLVDAAGLPLPIDLTAGFAGLTPTAILPEFVFTGNLLYSEQYGIPITNLLSAGDIWGLAPLAGLLPI
jgi:hypothetical protein